MRHDYWSEKISNSNILNNYISKNTNRIQESVCIEKTFEIDERIEQSIRKVSNNSVQAMYVVLLATIRVLLYKYANNEDDVCLGCHAFSKSNDNGAKVLPLIGKLENESSCIDVIKATHELMLELEANKNITMNDMVMLFHEKTGNYNAAFKTTVIINNLFNEINKRFYGEDFIYCFNVEEKRITIKILCFDQDCKEEDIDSLYSHLAQVQDEMISNPNQMISKISILTNAEREIIINQFNNTDKEYPREATLVDIFEKTVQKYGKLPAILYDGESLSYEELDRKSNSVAKLLREKGVSRNSIVGIMVNRSLEMLVGIIGIIKAGGAYMPMLPDYPEGRVSYMIGNSGVEIVLSIPEFSAKVERVLVEVNAQRLDNNETRIVSVIDITAVDKDGSEELEKINKPEDLLYVIYTSGSTGRPKGVMTNHTALINRINWMQRKYPLDTSDRILQKTSYCFDVSVWELLWGSFVGAAICMLKQGDELIPEKILEAISINNITVMHFVPSMFYKYILWMEEYSNRTKEMETLKYVFSSGEALPALYVNRFNEGIGKELGCLLVNLYGPTEAAIDVTYFDCAKGRTYDVIPIGRPIDNIKILILDQEMKLLPPGVPGELCISGIGVAQGYINNEKLTREKFVDSDYCKGKLYKTGDLVRWLEDGNIEYISRMDNQIKIRGLRIELGEIEATLEENEGIERATVHVKNIGDEDYIIAYIVRKKETSISTSALRKFLGMTLPKYMVPNYIIDIEEIPVTSNGKLDRSALESYPITVENESDLEEVVTDMERVVVDIWKRILQREIIYRNDNFFDIGGNSFNLLAVYNEILKYGELTIQDLYMYDTVKELALHLEQVGVK